MTRSRSRVRGLDVLHKTGARLHDIDALDAATMRDLAAFHPTPVEELSGEKAQARRIERRPAQAAGAGSCNETGRAS